VTCEPFEIRLPGMQKVLTNLQSKSDQMSYPQELTVEKCKKEIVLVQGIVQQGLRTEDFPYVGY
jgi:hypothetical protein